MADRPILFSAPMVRALLAGTKTQTRRVIKLPKWAAEPPEFEVDDIGVVVMCERTGCFADLPRVPKIGDRLWVKEQFIPDPSADDDAWDDWKASYYEWSGTGCRLNMVPPTLRKPTCVLFKADPRWQGDQGFKWRPSIHMPRWASRLTLTVTDVRVERLQDISEADAIAEGIGRDLIPDGLIPGGNTGFGFSDYSGFDTAKSAYAALWDSINGPGAWDASPWVIAVSFEVRHGNIDA
jgi:hypothetical protein